MLHGSGACNTMEREIVKVWWLWVFMVLAWRGAKCSVEVEALMEMKAAMDPTGKILQSWVKDGEPCTGSFEGVACNSHGKVANVSLQSKGLSGFLSPAVVKLRCLNGLYLHFNNLSGGIPKEVSNLTELVDLYLDVNRLSGPIPPEIASMSGLQALQLCCNRLNGSIPEELGQLKKLTVLDLKNNGLTGNIPASLGKLTALIRLDLSSNQLTGPIPKSLANLKQLTTLNLRNNYLSGTVPQDLYGLQELEIDNNLELCGNNASRLPQCNIKVPSDKGKPTATSRVNISSDPVATVPKLPESADRFSNCKNCSSSSSSVKSKIGILAAIIAAVFMAAIAVASLLFAWYRRRKQKISCTFDASDSRLSTDQFYHYKEDISRKCSSPLVLMEYSSDWDPTEDGGTGIECFKFNLEEIESATNYFSEKNLLGKNGFSSVFKGVLRDGSTVAVKCISKASCKTDDIEFQGGLRTYMQIRHVNLVKLRGFCCSKARAECFLVYEYIDSTTLFHILDSQNAYRLDWPTRVRIAYELAKGIEYLHQGLSEPVVHQNISAANILLDQDMKPHLSDCALHRILADDIVYSILKASAAMGYLAPEYATVGRLTLQSDVYAFGKVILQLLMGTTKNAANPENSSSYSAHSYIKSLVESGNVEEVMDPNLGGKYPVVEATSLCKIAVACTSELPSLRPAMSSVVRLLDTGMDRGTQIFS